MIPLNPDPSSLPPKSEGMEEVLHEALLQIQNQISLLCSLTEPQLHPPNKGLEHLSEEAMQAMTKEQLI